MTDLVLTEGADLALDSGDLVLDLGLASAVLRSLLTDARATELEASAVGATVRRGWWGDDEGDAWGSRLWLLRREKATSATLVRAREYAREALAWLLREGIAERVDIVATYVAGPTLHLAIRISRGSAVRWEHVWRGVRDAQHKGDGMTLALLFDGGGVR